MKLYDKWGLLYFPLVVSFPCQYFLSYCCMLGFPGGGLALITTTLQPYQMFCVMPRRLAKILALPVVRRRLVHVGCWLNCAITHLAPHNLTGLSEKRWIQASHTSGKGMVGLIYVNSVLEMFCLEYCRAESLSEQPLSFALVPKLHGHLPSFWPVVVVLDLQATHIPNLLCLC